MMKIVRYMRHSDKAGKMIGQAGLDRAQKEAPAGDYTDIFHGELVRTAQTALAIVASLGLKAKVHEPIEEIGTKERFEAMWTAELDAAIDSGMDTLTAVYSTCNQAQIDEFEAMAMAALYKVFGRIDDNGFALVIGHDPMISICAKMLGYQSARGLQPLEYIDFVMDQDGRLHVA